jgi:hypothetical protein
VIKEIRREKQIKKNRGEKTGYRESTRNDRSKIIDEKRPITMNRREKTDQRESKRNDRSQRIDEKRQITKNWREKTDHKELTRKDRSQRIDEKRQLKEVILENSSSMSAVILTHIHVQQTIISSTPYSWYNTSPRRSNTMLKLFRWKQLVVTVFFKVTVCRF